MRLYKTLSLLSLGLLTNCKPPPKARQKNFEAEENSWAGKSFHTLVMLAPPAAIEAAEDLGITPPPVLVDPLSPTSQGVTTAPTTPLGSNGGATTGGENTMPGPSWDQSTGAGPVSPSPSSSLGGGSNTGPSLGSATPIGPSSSSMTPDALMNWGSSPSSSPSMGNTSSSGSAMPTPGGAIIRDSLPPPTSPNSGFVRQYSSNTNQATSPNDIYMCWYYTVSSRSLATGNQEDRKKMYTQSKEGNFTASAVSLSYLIQEMQRNADLRDMYRSAAAHTARAASSAGGAVLAGGLVTGACLALGAVTVGTGLFACIIGAASAGTLGTWGGKTAANAATAGAAVNRLQEQMNRLQASSPLKKITVKQIKALRAILIHPQAPTGNACKSPSELDETDFSQIFGSQKTK